MRSSLFQCAVFHRRTSPVPYGFTTRTFMFLLDLDELDLLADELPLFGRNQTALYEFRDSDHIFLGASNVRHNLENYLSQSGLSTAPKRIELLTNLRTMGYVFNPVSFYFCYDDTDAPLAVVAEVHNTFGELKPFLLTRADLVRQQFHRSMDKLFYISPFSELENRLEIKASFPGEKLALYVNSSRPGEDQPFFRSSLTGSRTPLTTAALAGYSVRFPFMTLKVIAMIHWHALRLWKKGAPFHRKSANPQMQRDILPKKHQINA
jgi:DUF1365 family protein